MLVDLLSHLEASTPEEKRALVFDLMSIQVRDGNKTRNQFLYDLCKLIDHDYTIQICTTGKR